MTYKDSYSMGHLVLPGQLLVHLHELFPQAEDYLVWQFFFYQNTNAISDMPPSQVAQALGVTTQAVDGAIERLQAIGALEIKKTSESNGEIETLFDASPALDKLDRILESNVDLSPQPHPLGNALKSLVADLEGEFGRLATPMEIEELDRMLKEDKLPSSLIRAALKESSLNKKHSMRYMQAILRNWRNEGITTVEQVEAKREERYHALKTPSPGSLSTEALAAMDMWKNQ